MRFAHKGKRHQATGRPEHGIDQDVVLARLENKIRVPEEMHAHHSLLVTRFGELYTGKASFGCFSARSAPAIPNYTTVAAEYPWSQVIDWRYSHSIRSLIVSASRPVSLTPSRSAAPLRRPTEMTLRVIGRSTRSGVRPCSTAVSASAAVSPLRSAMSAVGGTGRPVVLSSNSALSPTT